MRQVGYTLVEIAIVVVILSIAAAAVLQTSASVDVEQTLDAAAAEVAAALRFARSEAIRSGEDYGVMLNTSSQTLRVYRLPPGGPPDYTIRHPVDTKLYQMDFDTHPMFAPVSIASLAFWYEGDLVPSSFAGFLASTGTPKTTDGFGTRPLASGSITLAAGGQTRVISVAPMTGRVTVQ